MLNIGGHIAIFIVGRTLQGISAAVVWTVGLALVSDTVGSENIGQQMGKRCKPQILQFADALTGYVSIAMSLGILVAPLLGGVVFARAGYNAVFAIQYALIG